MPLKTDQVPPLRVSPDALKDLRGRADACGLLLSEYVRYRLFGKKVLTGEQVEQVKKQEKLIE